MNKINHHLSEKLLLDYANGNLDEAFSLAVATHISMCDECRATLHSIEAVGGAFLDTTEPQKMAENSLELTMALIKKKPPQSRNYISSKSQLNKSSDHIPSVLQDYIGGSLSDVKWRSIGMGVKQAILKTQGDAVARLLYIPAGTAVPHHGHTGKELTLVLKGAFHDEVDHFGPGDVEIADEDLNHAPVASSDQDCICLAVTDAPLKFPKIIHRIVQPFLKI